MTEPPESLILDDIKISLYAPVMDLLEAFRALADPSRLRIMLLLQQMELAVGELAVVLDQSQPRVSRHVRILAEAGLAERRREGSWVFLRRRQLLPGSDARDRAIEAAIDTLIQPDHFHESGLARQSGNDRQRLIEIRTQREAQAANFFAAHAAEWDKMRSLYVPEQAVESQLRAMIGVRPVEELLDIGTGTGRMAELFAPLAAHVTALDNSPEMLRLARARLHDLGPKRCDLVQADFRALPLVDAHYDLVLLHQVLHFAQDPETVLREAARVTRAGGRIAIIDFDAHDLEELRRVNAHARLGFSDQQMHGLLAQAGFCLCDSAAMAGDPLTVKIWIAERLTPGTAHAFYPEKQMARKAQA